MLRKNLKIAHTADFHIGALKTSYPHGYLERARVMLDELQQSLLAYEVDLLLVCGDIFERYSPSEDERVLFSEFLVSCAKAHYPQHTVILPGNHDAERDYMGALSSIQRIASQFIPNLSLHTDLAALEVQDSGELLCQVDPESEASNLRILMLPDEYVPHLKRISRAIHKGAKEMDDPHVYRALKQAHVIVSHYPAKGSVFETGVVGGSVDIPYAHFDNTMLWCLGDIHKMQKIHDAPGVWYCGTPYQKNFGERLPKGYLLHVFDLESGGVQTEFIELTRATPLMTYDILDMEEFKHMINQVETPFDGKLVKYRYRDAAFEDVTLPANFIIPEFVSARPIEDADTPEQTFDEGFELAMDLFDGIDRVIAAYCPDDKSLIPEIKAAAMQLRADLNLH